MSTLRGGRRPAPAAHSTGRALTPASWPAGCGRSHHTSLGGRRQTIPLRARSPACSQAATSLFGPWMVGWEGAVEATNVTGTGPQPLRAMAPSASATTSRPTRGCAPAMRWAGSCPTSRPASIGDAANRRILSAVRTAVGSGATMRRRRRRRRIRLRRSLDGAARISLRVVVRQQFDRTRRSGARTDSAGADAARRTRLLLPLRDWTELERRSDGTRIRAPLPG